ncbi:hypothetical protein F1C58_16115 (plasmid) [Glaciihabitans sp. INWT7]|uniref:hypothetical protein n=1 Tax=Glaciihabitans sp. INWT7 TaxID=2596912 RepID=UPI001624D006|nr:hypothetical protein [Glaciihabitans sp. INWT7]QNE48586.1 hypothetical protein F1C58_16115 [Glaciihabitans sp. INWT7]
MTTQLHPNSAAIIHTRPRAIDIGFLAAAVIVVVQLVLVTLRLTGIVEWDWRFVLLPVTGSIMLCMGVAIGMLVVGLTIAFWREVRASAKRVFHR